VTVSLLPQVLRGRSAAARWAIVAFTLACIGGNPSDFGFIVAIVVAWAAYAAPHARRTIRTEKTGPRWVRGATVAAFGMVALASIPLNLAAFSYADARDEVTSNNLSAARDHLSRAAALDPGMALYARQRGIVAYLQGDLSAAAVDLERATDLNPADDLAWRALALAHLADGRTDAGEAALSRAVDLQHSDVANLLVLARETGEQERFSDATALLAKVVQSWPAIVAAPHWEDVLPASVTTADVIDAAVTRWETGQSALEPQVDQALWLVAMGDRRDLERRAIADAVIGPTLAEATIAVTRCDPAASEILDRASASEQRSPVYDVLRQRIMALDQPPEAAANAVGDGARVTLNPLNENSTWSSDAWGYRRLPIAWPPSSSDLPSPQAGLIRWLARPKDAVASAGLQSRLPACA
jgi:tetratricopeptide (TPR) repeat protein